MPAADVEPEPEEMSSDGMYACKLPSGPLELTMREGYTARDLATAYIGVSCANVILPVELADRAHDGGFHGRLKPAEIEPRFRALFEELGLLLIRKDGLAIVVDQSWLVHRPGMILLRREDPALAITERAPDPVVGGDDTHHVVPRTEINDAIANNTHGARVIPWVQNGVPAGAKLYAVRPDSIYAHAGLTNGDTVLVINGVDVRAPDQLLIDKLFSTDHLELSILRRGKPMTLTIEIE